MGKATGFLDYERKNAKAETPLERIRHFREFRTPLAAEEQKEQGGRNGRGLSPPQSGAGDK